MLKHLLFGLFMISMISCSSVIILSDSNFTEFVSRNEYVLVKFYAPWCGHCKSMVPEYEKLAAEAQTYIVAEVDCTQNENLTKQFSIEGYPTLKFFAHANPVDYSGPRKYDQMSKWVNQFLTSKIQTIQPEEVQNKIGQESFLLITGASDQVKNQLSIANAIEQDINFYYTEGDSLKITLHLKNKKVFEFVGTEIKTNIIVQWVQTHSLPALVPLNSRENVGRIYQKSTKSIITFIQAADSTNEVFNEIEAFCEAHKDTHNCAYATPDHEVYNGISKYLKIQNKQVSTLALIQNELKEAYVFSGETSQINQQSISKFVAEVAEGKIQKRVDGSKEPAKEEVEYVNVVKLTNETYDSTIKNNKYVFIEYYSPGCGHCVQFAPEYERLATLLKEQNSEFVIAAVDVSTEPDISEKAQIQGYPTLKFFVSGVEIDYTGARKAEQIAQFIKLASKSELLLSGSVAEIPKPAVAIHGLSDSNSGLKLLPILFTKYPVYQISIEGEPLSVELHGETVIKYEGETFTAKAVSQWLTEVTEPILINVNDQNPGPRLKNAMEKQHPLLIFVQREEIKQDHVLLENYCRPKTGLACGFATKGTGEYQGFNTWLNDPRPDTNSIVYLTTADFSKYFYNGLVNEITSEELDNFITQIKNGEIKPQSKNEEQGEQPQNTEGGEPQATESSETSEPAEVPEKVAEAEVPEVGEEL